MKKEMNQKAKNLGAGTGMPRKRSFADRAMYRLAEIWFTFFPPKN
jgi:hypothetical protein